MTQQYYTGRYIRSDEFTGPNAERLAWDDWLAKLTDYIRENPSLRFVWRVQPTHEIDRQFESNDECHIVYGRLVGVLGDGDLPHLGPSSYQDSIVAGERAA